MASTSRSVFLIYFYSCLPRIEIFHWMFSRRLIFMFNKDIRKFFGGGEISIRKCRKRCFPIGGNFYLLMFLSFVVLESRRIEWCAMHILTRRLSRITAPGTWYVRNAASWLATGTNRTTDFVIFTKLQFTKLSFPGPLQLATSDEVFARTMCLFSILRGQLIDDNCARMLTMLKWASFLSINYHLYNIE